MKPSPSHFGCFNRSLFSGLYLTAVAALLFTLSSRTASADNETWLGNTSDWNTVSNWQGYYAPGAVPEGGWGNNAYFSIATPNSTILFTQPNNDPGSLFFTGHSGGDTVGSLSDTTDGLNLTTGFSGIFVLTALQGSNQAINIDAPINAAGAIYFGNYTPEAGQPSLAGLPGQAGSGTNNVLNINGPITGGGGLTVVGIGDININGGLQNTNGTSMAMDTTGIVTLGANSNNTTTGGIVVGGTLVIDNTGSTSSILPNIGYMALGNNGNGGNLIINGANGGSTIDMPGNFQIRTGANSITVNSGTSGVTQVNLPASFYGDGPYFTQALNITLNDNGSGTSVITTTSLNRNWYGYQTNLLGSGTVTINQDGQTYFAQAGPNFSYDPNSQVQAPTAINALVMDDGDTFQPAPGHYPGNFTVNEATPGTTPDLGTQTLTSDSSANSFRFGNANALDLGGHTLTMSLGGILVSENVSGNTAIENGTLDLQNGVGFMNYGTGVLDVSASINNEGSRGIAKFGDGLVILSGDNGSTFTNGFIQVSQGVLQAGSATAFGTGNAVSMGDASSVLDLHGSTGYFTSLSSDQDLGLSGGQAAALGYNTNVANLAAGTVSQVVLTANAGTGVYTPYGPNYGYSYNYGLGSYYGGWQEASGAILGLQLANGTAPATNFDTGSGDPIFFLSMGTIYDPTGGNGTDASGINGTSNVISGAVSIGRNTELGLGGYGNFQTLGVTTLDGSMAALAQQGNGYSTTYLAGAYGLNTYTQSGTTFSRGNILSSNTGFNFTINEQGSATDEYAGQLGTASIFGSASFTVGGTGTLKLDNAAYSNSITVEDASSLIMPALATNTNLIIGSSATVTVTDSSTSGDVATGGNRLGLYGGQLTIAPGGSGANVFVTGAGNDSYLQYDGGSTILLDKGANTSLTYQYGNTNTFTQFFNTNQGGTIDIGSAQGLAALGNTDKFVVLTQAGTSTQGGNAIYQGSYAIVSPQFLGVNFSPGSRQDATFLTYNGTGTATDAGYQAVTFAGGNINNINGSAFSSVEQITANSTQNLTSNVQIYALQIDQGGVLNTGINANNIGFGNSDGNVNYGGIILNGGSITGNGLYLNRQTNIYTDLDNGSISSIAANGQYISKSGPGTLYLGSLDMTNYQNRGYVTQIDINGGALDVGNLDVVKQGQEVTVLHGGVLQGYGAYDENLGGGGGNVAWNISNDYSDPMSGGFSARGGALSVTLNGGSQLTWGVTGSFVQEGGALMFGSLTSDNVVTLTNDINLGVINGAFSGAGGLYSRVVSVTANANDAGIDPLSVADYTVLSGSISQSNSYQGLAKDGNGVLYLTGNNTYTGATTIAGGALVISSDSNLGTAPTAAYALNTTPTIDGVVTTGGALTPGAVLIDSGATLVTTNSLALGGSAGTRTILLGSGTSGAVAAASNIDVVGATNTLTFNGLIGDYVNEVGVLNKEGDGTLALGGDSYYTGATIISGGTINLSGTLNNGNAWNGSGGAGPLGGVGTDLVFQGKGGGFIYDYSNAGQSDVGRQNMGELALNGGGATVENDSETQANTLAFTSLSNGMGNGTTVNFIIPNLGGITFGSGVTNDAVMGPNAYFDGYDFAYYDGTVGVKATDFSGGAPGTVIVAGQFDSSVPYVLAAGGFDQGQNAAITGLLILDGVGITQNQTVSTGTTLTVQSILESTYAGNASPGTATIGGGFLTTGNGTPLFIRTDAVGDILDVGDEILSSSTGGLTKSGDGTLILSNSAMGANAYTGGTVITGGTLELGDGSTPDDTHDGNLGAGAVVNYGALVVNNYGDTVIGNDISGDGTLLLTGGGTGAATVELTGNNSYSGATEVENGTLQIGTSGSLSAQTDVMLGNGTNSGVLVLGDGTGGAISATLANLSTSGTGTGNAVVGGNGSISNLTVANNADDTFGGTIGGTGTNQNNLGLTKSGTADLNLTGTNSYTGGTVVDGGVLTLGSAGALGNTSGIQFVEGTLQFTSANTTDYSSIIANSTGAIQIDTNGQNITFANNLASSNVAGLNKVGSGTLTLLAASQYSGDTSVSGGTLAVSNISMGLGANPYSFVYLSNGGALQLVAPTSGGFPSYDFVHSIVVEDGGGVFIGNGDDYLDSPINGPNSSITFDGGDILYRGNASNVGTINVAAGRVLMFNNNLNLIANNATVNVSNGATFDFGSDTDTVTNSINLSSGSALETRGGVLTFTNVALPTSGSVTLGADDVGGGSMVFTTKPLALTGDLTLAINANGGNTTPVTLSMNITGTGGLIETAGPGGVSNLTINGTNSYSGQTTVNSGGLVVISGNNSGTGTVDHSVNVENGTLQIATGGSISSASNLTLGNGTTSGVFVLGDATNSNNVTVASLNNAGTGTGNAVVNGGSGSTSTFTVNGGGTYGGAIGGGGSNQNNVALVKSNGGTLDLTGNTNTYTGGTTVNGGALLVNNTNSLSSGTGSGVVQVNTGSVLGGSGFIAGGGITIASGAQLAPGLDPLGVASGVMTLTSVGEAPVLTLETPASPSTPAQLSFMLGAGVNPATEVGAGTVLSGGVTLMGSSTYIKLAVDAAGEVVFSTDTSLPTLASIDLLNHDSTGLGNYLLFAGGADSDYANLIVNGVLNDDANGFSNGLITGGLDLFPINDQSGQLFLENGNIYVDMETVPEPGTWAMLVMGLALLGGACYRRARRAAALLAAQ